MVRCTIFVFTVLRIPVSKMSSFPVCVPLRLTKCFQVLMRQDRVNELLKEPASKSGKEALTLKEF